MKQTYLTIITLFFALQVFTQQTNIVGNVYVANLKEPLPGVNVTIQDTSKGVITNFDGNFSLSNVSIGSTLIFSYLGFKTQEIRVTDLTTLEVYMQEDISALDEVIIIGYGTKKRKEITGAVAVVGSDVIEELNPTRIEQALQGQVAGVNITSESGSPGGSSNIRIRGISTNGDNRPLILVDGNVIEDLSVLNPSDIESINVLKDATAGIYGVRAANGVILITTKTGKKNSDLKFSLDVYGGFQQTSRIVPVLNATEYALLVNEAAVAGGQTPPINSVSNLGIGTNWQNEVFKNAPIYNNSVIFSGGTSKSTYSFGASLLTQDGIVGGNKANFTRYTTRLNFNTDILSNLKLTTNILYQGTNRKGLAESGIGSVLFNALNNAPTFNVRDANGKFSLADGLGNEVINPIAQIENTFNNNEVNKISGKAALNFKFWKNFTLESGIQFNYAEVQGRNFSPTVFFGAGKVFNNTGRPSLTVNKDLFKDYTIDSFLNYEKYFGENHKLNLTLGTSAFATKGDFSGGTQGFFEVPTTFAEARISQAVDLRNGLKDAGLSGKFDERLLSYFTRIQYNFKGKYLLSAVLRRDGSTKFGPNNRFGYFPSGSVGWIVSEEEFLTNSTRVNFLKLRGSFGILGNDRIPGNAYRSILNGEATYVFNNQLVFGQAVGVLSNPEIRWEEQTTLDVGLDLELFNNKISLTFDYFTKRTDGLLLQPQVSGILGANAPGAQAPVVNGGVVDNSGFEFIIGFNHSLSDKFSIGLNYNATFLENEVIEVNNEAGFLQGGSFGVGQDPPSRMQAGKPIGFFYGLETNGVFQNQSEVDEHAIQANTAAGDLRFVDQNSDGIINSDDRVDIGNPIPDMTMGFNMNVNYKQIDFTAYFFASMGNEIVRNYERNQPLVNKSVFSINRWTGEGSSDLYPRVTSGATSNTLFSDFFIEDGSFARIQNAQIGYTFSDKFIEKMKIDKLRLYLSANNLYTFTKYRGYDPSASSGSPIGAGIDFGFYPVPRTYLLGVNFKF